jgi:hypothetical protein
MSIKLSAHNGFVIAERKNSADMIDPRTGKWQNFKTPRLAKWSATVYARLHSGFDNPVPTAKDAENYLKGKK